MMEEIESDDQQSMETNTSLFFVCDFLITEFSDYNGQT
jgi:hypothetical protein